MPNNNKCNLFIVVTREKDSSTTHRPEYIIVTGHPTVLSSSSGVVCGWLVCGGWRSIG